MPTRQSGHALHAAHLILYKYMVLHGPIDAETV